MEKSKARNRINRKAIRVSDCSWGPLVIRPSAETLEFWGLHAPANASIGHAAIAKKSRPAKR
jgi:hypothetical protein